MGEGVGEGVGVWVCVGWGVCGLGCVWVGVCVGGGGWRVGVGGCLKRI